MRRENDERAENSWMVGFTVERLRRKWLPAMVTLPRDIRHGNVHVT